LSILCRLFKHSFTLVVGGGIFSDAKYKHPKCVRCGEWNPDWTWHDEDYYRIPKGKYLGRGRKRPSGNPYLKPGDLKDLVLHYREALLDICDVFPEPKKGKCYWFDRAALALDTAPKIIKSGDNDGVKN